jgi:hypothetical protein
VNTRNFHFLKSPVQSQRLGRYVASGAILIGAPVVADGTVDANGQRSLSLATGATVPKRGKHGILFWVNPYSVAAGFDPATYGYGDLDRVPVGASVQLCSGDDIRIRLQNTADDNFERQRDYPARTMVAGIGIATPTLAVDDYIGPGIGDDTAGYWAETDAAHAWAIVTAVYNDTGELDAQLVF